MRHIFHQTILSVLSLLFEISYSRFYRNITQRNNLETTVLSKLQKFTFSSQSKCGDLRNARKQFNLLQNIILCEDELKITYSEMCDNNDVELSISLIFELNSPEKIGEIALQFDEFTLYLDGISIK